QLVVAKTWEAKPNGPQDWRSVVVDTQVGPEWRVAQVMDCGGLLAVSYGGSPGFSQLAMANAEWE
ncbi:MAG TPA: hypothetical protein VEI97_05220, partial [bacterium]|nr:hypothetical protein [bacterium]